MILSGLLRRRRDAELAQEIAAHLEAEREENLARGMTLAEADRQARIKIGSARRVHEDLWQQNSLVVFENLARDLKYAVRTLARTPAFTLAAVFTMAVGIGATSLVFSIVYGAVLNPYPYRDAERITQMGFASKQGIRGFMAVNAHDFQTVRRAGAVEDAMLSSFSDPITTISGYPEDVESALFSGNAFDFLGVRPRLGRTLTAQDQDQPVVVLGDAFCRAHFPCDQSVLGRTLDLDRRQYTIVGVMPPRFAWEHASIFVPLVPGSDPDDIYPLYLRAKKGVRTEALSAQMLALVRRFVLVSEGVEFPPETRLTPVALGQRGGGSMQKRLMLLFVAVCILLLIACVNVSILLLGRAGVRRHEFEIRNALGATRLRLARQVLAEALVIALCGGILGVAITYAGVALLRAPLVASFFPQEAVLTVNGWVLAFSTLISVATGIVFGLIPSLQVSRGLKTPGLHVQSLSASRRHRRSQRILIASQIASTFLLLAMAGAAIRSFVDLYKIDLGYDPHHVLTFRLPVPAGQAAGWAARLQYRTSLRDRLQQIPGVQQASIDDAMPTGGGFPMEYALPGEHFGPDMDIKMPRADIELIDPQFLSTVRIGIVAGRPFTEGEYAGAQPVALINRSFARRLFGTENPIGRVVRVPPLIAGYPGVQRPRHPDQMVRIVGVTGDVRAAWLSGAPPRETIYLPQSLFLRMSDLRVHLRTAQEPVAILETARRVVKQFNSGQPISQVRTLDDILSRDLRNRDRWLAILFAAFSGIALFLAAVGLYSIVSFAMTQRTREFGVRIALGAPRQAIFRIAVFSEGAVVLSGLVAGIALSLLLSKLLRATIGLPVQDVRLLVASSVVLLAVTALACLIPAQRAARLDPAKTLRAE